MKKKQNEAGFSYIETMIAIVILSVGILGSLSALTFGVLSVRESEMKTKAKELAGSSVETIFAVRDLKSDGAISSWDKIAVNNGSNSGIFLDDWRPVRENPGYDGIYGTADDACPAGNSCTVGGYTNSSSVIQGFQRRVEITDIVENGVVKKRRLNVRIRYPIGNLFREEAVATIIANLPFN